MFLAAIEVLYLSSQAPQSGIAGPVWGLVSGTPAALTAVPVRDDRDLTNATCRIVPAGKVTAGADGCVEAPAGTPQHPKLLDIYQGNRPPWNVAGVDYHVGLPEGTRLTDWQNIDIPGVDIADHYIRCSGAFAAKPASGPVVLDKIDFTTHGGAKAIYIPAQGCASMTVSDSRFGNAGGTAGCDASSYYQIQSQNPGTRVEVIRSTFDMTNCRIGGAAVIATEGPTVIRYNYFGHFQGQILQAPAGAYTIDDRYNLIEDGCYGAGNHMNFQEFGGPVDAASDMVAFNTTYEYQATPCGGEEFQFYGNRGGTQHAASFAYNTLIALDTGACRSHMTNCLVSYAVHGHAAYEPMTTLSGPAYNMHNYFDPRGMYGAYYPNSMKGWISSGNTDMTTGHTITPP